MTDKWKDIFIMITLGVVAILAISWLVDTLLIDGLNVDKGFLGSVLGGTIGTLGVIVTTYFLIEANKKATKDAANLQDKQIRDRDYTTFLLKQIEEVKQLHYECNKLINKDSNLLRLTADSIKDIGVFRENFAGVIENSDENTRTRVLDWDSMIVSEFNNLKREEEELRYEIIEKLQRLKGKDIFIPRISEELSEIYIALNVHYKKIQDYYIEDGTNKTESIDQIIEEMKGEYTNRSTILDDKLKEITLEIVNIYTKAP